MKKGITWLWRIIWKTVLWFFVGSVGLVVLYRFVPVPITPLMIIRWVEYKSAGEEYGIAYDWTPMEEISSAMQRAVVASEDQKFTQHNGFDWEAMQTAWENNKKGKNVKGASTITQQTVKNVFLWPGRTYLRKGLEAYFTVLVELIWPKERILEVYLNVIEVGSGKYGVGTAASSFYKTTPAKLNSSQAAMIAALLPSPRRWNPNRPTPYLVGRQGWIRVQMRNLGPLPWEGE
ncbi:monofunctional biosynthetic peptidoglycan transglycosylase [Algoriphagus namhaensis]